MRKFTTKSFWFALATAMVLTIVSGVVHGFLDGRWVSRPDVIAMAAQLKTLPTQFGDWSLSENQTLSETEQRILQCYGYTLQIYQNLQTGSRVSVAVLLGPRGPMSVHTPDICYAGQGYETQGDESRVVVEAQGESHDFWRISLASKMDPQPALESYYAWSDGRAWKAAKHPRLWMTPRLYKIQLACAPTEPGQTSEAEKFLEQFLPELKPLLVSTTL